MRISAITGWLSVALALAIAQQAAAIPSDELLKSLGRERPSSPINDYAGLLSPSEKAALEARSQRLLSETGAALVVVTLKSLQGGEIDDFTNKLFAQWGIGDKQQDNGLLLLVAIDERKARIEIGYGLEPIIPDMLAGRIIDYDLRPRFREQQYAAGLSAAVNKLADLVEKGEPADRTELAAKSLIANLPMLLMTTLFVAIGGFLIGTGLGLKNGRTIVSGFFFGGVAMLMGLAAAGLIGPMLHIPVALLTSLLGWNATKQGGGRRSSRRSTNVPWTWSDSSTTWGGGGWTSGGGGGFSGSWGGFGGGSSGGGGASGGW